VKKMFAGLAVAFVGLVLAPVPQADAATYTRHDLGTVVLRERVQHTSECIDGKPYYVKRGFAFQQDGKAHGLRIRQTTTDRDTGIVTVETRRYRITGNRESQRAITVWVMPQSNVEIWVSYFVDGVRKRRYQNEANPLYPTNCS